MADVAVVGCGLMGSAIARQLAAVGHTVTAWNRTAEKARALAAYGVTAVDSVAEAVSGTPLVVTCTATYETTLSALGPVTDWTGVTLVNHSVGTPGDARSMAGWAAARGAAYLDGIPACFPKDIGDADAMLLYSGPASAWQQHAPTLESLGGASRLVSEDVASTNVLEIGVGGFFITAQRAYIEAVDYLEGEAVSPEAIRMLTGHLIDLLRTTSNETVDAVELGNRLTAHADQATLAMFGEAARINLAELRAAGHRAPLLSAAVQDLDALVAAGHGDAGVHARGAGGPADA